MNVGLARSINDLVHWNITGVVAVRYVFSNAAVEQYRLLGDDADL